MKECADLQCKHYATSTSKTRAAEVKVYLDFCEKFLLEPAPCPPHQVALFITYMTRRIAASTIRNYVSGLNYFLKCERAPPVDYDNFQVKRALSGASRVLGEATKQAAPLLPAQLKLMLGVLSEAPVHVLFRAAILTSFRALLRKQNVTDSNAALKCQDFTFHPWGMLISLGKSKTIQKGESTVLIPVTYTPDPELCAVRWNQRNFAHVEVPPGGPAFAYPSSPPGALPYKTYQAAIKWMAGAVNLNPEWFSSHSLRRGGATFLWLTTGNVEEVKKRGDWDSDAYLAYLSTPLEDRIQKDLEVAAAIAAAALV